MLRRTKGSFELLDVSEALPALRRVPGKPRWRVMDAKGRWFESWEAAEEQKVRACVC